MYGTMECTRCKQYDEHAVWKSSYWHIGVPYSQVRDDAYHHAIRDDRRARRMCRIKHYSVRSAIHARSWEHILGRMVAVQRGDVPIGKHPRAKRIEPTAVSIPLC